MVANIFNTIQKTATLAITITNTRLRFKLVAPPPAVNKMVVDKMFLEKMSRRHFISVPITWAYYNSPTFHHFTAYLSALMSAPSLPSQIFLLRMLVHSLLSV